MNDRGEFDFDSWAKELRTNPVRDTEKALQRLLEATSQLKDAFDSLANLAETLEPKLSRKERAAMRRLYSGIIATMARAYGMIPAVRSVPKLWFDRFLNGMVLGLLKADRADLISEDPMLENAWFVMEAEQLLKTKPE